MANENNVAVGIIFDPFGSVKTQFEFLASINYSPLSFLIPYCQY